MRNLFATLMVGACLAAPAAQADEFSITGVGAGTCGEFADMYRLDPELARSAYLSWAQGFLSAVNMARYGNGIESLPVFYADQAADVADGIWHAIRYHCNQHPLDDFTNAVFYAGGE